MSYSLDTYITIGFPGSVEHEIKLELIYEASDAYAEITDAHVVEQSGARYPAPEWLWAMFEDNDELQTEMMREADEHDEANREARAEYEYEKRLERNQ